MTRLFSIKKKLAGIFTPRSVEERMSNFQRAIDESAKVELFLQSQSWFVVEKILQDFHNKAVQEMSNNGASVKVLERANHRLELIKDYHYSIDRIVTDGAIALKEKQKLKEKQDDRREQPERTRAGSVNASANTR